MVKSDEQKTLDIKDITGSGFIYRRYLGTLLALVTAFVTLLGGVAGSGYGVIETVSELLHANNSKHYAQEQLKDYKSFDETNAKTEKENLKVEIEQLKKIQETTNNYTFEESSEKLTGAPEEIIKAIARQAYDVFCEDMGYNLYRNALYAHSYLNSKGVYVEDYPSISALSNDSEMEKIAESYDEYLWVDYTVNEINTLRDTYAEDSIYMSWLLTNAYVYVMGASPNWFTELQKAMICEHVENNLQDYPYIDNYNYYHNYGKPLTSFLYFGIEDAWLQDPWVMPYDFAEDYANAIMWFINDLLLNADYQGFYSINPSTREKYTQELLDTLHISYSGNLSELTYQELINLYSTSKEAAKEEVKAALAALNVDDIEDIEDIPNEIKKREERIEEIEETIERYGNVNIKSIEAKISDKQSEVNRNFVYTAGLGGTAALLLTFAISVMLVFFDYLKKRKTFFEIQYAGGRIAFVVSYYAIAEIEDFQKMLRRAKDLAESVVMEPARTLVQPSNEKNNQTVDKADELRKYAKLLEDGLISQEEYDAMKKKVLGL